MKFAALVFSCPLARLLLKPRAPVVTQQTIVEHDATSDGVSVTLVGPSHVVEGSVEFLDVPAGMTVVIRHLDGTSPAMRESAAWRSQR